MNNKKLFFHAHQTGLVVLGATFLGALTGCVGYVDGPRAQVYAAPPVVETQVVIQDDYVYYPRYEVYYSSSRHEYAYHEGSAWVSRPAPRGVKVNVLLASPSVHMDFHDSPGNHHAEVTKQYPKNWKPSAPAQGPKENRDGDKRDEHRGNDGK